MLISRQYVKNDCHVHTLWRLKLALNGAHASAEKSRSLSDAFIIFAWHSIERRDRDDRSSAGSLLIDKCF